MKVTDSTKRNEGPDVPLAENIRNYMHERNMSQEQLAARMGMSQQVVSTWCRGNKLPSVRQIYRLAEVLEVSFDDLFCKHDGPAGFRRMTLENMSDFYRVLFPDNENPLILDNYIKACDSTIRHVLNEKEARAVIMRYGLDGEKPKGYGAISGELGITKQRVDQILAKSVQKLQAFREYFIPASGELENKAMEKAKSLYRSSVHRILKDTDKKLDVLFGYRPGRGKTMVELSRIPVQYAGLDSNTLSRVIRCDVRSVGDLLATSDEVFMRTPSIGVVSLGRIHNKQQEILADPDKWMEGLRAEQNISYLSEIIALDEEEIL